jgi:ribosome assembly protein YihI (activator of Der GTPase)
MGSLSDDYNGTGKSYSLLISTSPKKLPYTKEMEKELDDSEPLFEELDKLRAMNINSVHDGVTQEYFDKHISRIRELRNLCGASDRKVREMDYVLNEAYYKHWGVI